ncbi:MAG: hypothetical protein HY397_01925 [Candidatus Doudnabacteria bacterium]|nr:hypothetical protein [Candidatus Doudnabacteria bacterium]
MLKKLFSRLLMGFSSFGIIGLVWSGLRYLAIPYLGLRFVAALIIATFLLWFLFVLKYLLFQYSTEQSEWAQAQLKKRYLKIK